MNELYNFDKNELEQISTERLLTITKDELLPYLPQGLRPLYMMYLTYKGMFEAYNDTMGRLPTKIELAKILEKG